MKRLTTLLSLSSLALGACAADGDTLVVTDGDVTKSGDGKYDSSVEAVFVDMEFDGTVLAASSFGAERTIEDQLLYTVGSLNDERSVSRLDRVDISNIETKNVADGVEVSYHVRLPVAWGRRENVPATYTFTLPRDASFSGQRDFTDKYKESCVDFGAHDVTSGVMWYYYRPESFGCDIDPADVVTVEASVSLSTINTTGKFPEYDKVWEDDTLEVLAVFGKYEDGATSNGDAGITSYNSFVSKIRRELAPFSPVTVPADIPSIPGVDTPDVELTATLPDGKTVHVVALLIDSVRSADATFDARYASLSAHADMIAYNGHSGLGSNIRALARKGSWIPGQYVVVFMNGCDTYAYVDDAINRAHADINDDDDTGTKYVDMVTNAMPSFFHSTPAATMAIIRGLMSYDEPVTYEKIFTNIDSAQVVLVSGEADNEFVPGGGGEGQDWDGIDDSGTVARDQEVRFTSPVLEPGRYVFDMTGSGDADLYVRVGSAPTTSDFDCRPFKASSNETCAVDITTPVAVHVMVRGWASSSEYHLVGGAE